MFSYTCRHRNRIYTKLTRQLLKLEVPFMLLSPSNSSRFSEEEELISSFLIFSPKLILTLSKPGQRQFLDAFRGSLSSAFQEAKRWCYCNQIHHLLRPMYGLNQTRSPSLELWTQHCLLPRAQVRHLYKRTASILF